MICKKHGELTEDQICKEKSKYVKRGYQLRCIECRRDKDRLYKLNNPDKHKRSANRKRDEHRKLYREGLIDIEPRANILARENRKNNPEKHREWSRKIREKLGQFRNTREVCRRLSWSVDDYYKMLNEQNNKCAICNLEETRKSRTNGKICALAIDHNHETNEVRALLCHSCNTGIGKFKENIDLLNSAIEYLKKHNAKDGLTLEKENEH